MNDREDLARRLYEACLSGSVPALEALLEKDQLILDRVSSLLGFFNDTPLHIVALRGHLGFTKALLARKPELTTELDSLRRSPLHLASAGGHIGIVQELLRVNKKVCMTRDQDGKIPLHLAAMKGRVDVIQELLEAEPNSIHEKLDRGETVLHLCVKYNKLEALKTLMQYLQANKDESLLNSKNDDGNTILHLAAALKQMETIEYLFGIKSVKDHANVKNKNNSTALDVVEYCPNRDLKTMEIREFLLQAGVRRSVCGDSDPNPESPPTNAPPPPQRCCKAGKMIMGCISAFWTNFIKVDPIWLQEVRGHLITASTLTATMAYQSIMSPPGGFWSQTDPGKTDAMAPVAAKIPGHTVLESNDHHDDDFAFASYMAINTIMLMASFSTIMLAMTGFPMRNKLLKWVLVFTVYVSMGCMAGAYLIALILVSPDILDKYSMWNILYKMMLVGLGVCGFVLLLHTCHFLAWLAKILINFSKCVKAACCKRCCGSTPRATPNTNSTDPAAGNHNCLGSIC